jgi:ribosome-associated translation inhibitor RaiA
MVWQLKDSGVRRPHDLPEYIERRLRHAIVRFGSRVEKVFVFLQDANGPRGGLDKICRILVKTRGCGVVVAAVADTDWYVAVDRATSRVGHSLGRHVARHRARQATSPRRFGPGLSAAPAV